MNAEVKKMVMNFIRHDLPEDLKRREKERERKKSGEREEP